MAVIRINKTSDYTVMSNTHFREKDMTLKAKGLLSLMLSLPESWDYSIGGLVLLSKDGKDSVMNALNELEEFGYLKRTKVTDEKGRFAGYDYDIFETPQTEKPYAENPNTDNPNTGKPNAENPPQLNTNILSTNLVSTNKSNTDDYNSYSSGGVIELLPFSAELEEGEEIHPEEYYQLHTGILKCDRGLVLMSDYQFDLLCRTLSFDEVNFYVKRLSDYIYNFKQKTGKEPQIKSHYATILKWVEEDRNG